MAGVGTMALTVADWGARNSPFRVLVCGGRDFSDSAFIYSTLGKLRTEMGPLLIIHGAATGADTLASCWAKDFAQERAFPADWKRHGRAAGAIRNKQMLDEAKPELVIAFAGGRGTANMMKQAKERGIEVWAV